MKCDDRALSFSWWSEQMTAEVTAGSCMGFSMQQQELMTFDTYPQSKRMNWMNNDNVLVLDVAWWNLDKGAFADVVVVTDYVNINLNGRKLFNDSVGTADQIYLHTTKVFGDTVSTLDDFLAGSREPLKDTISASDHGQITVQNYFSNVGAPNGYFASDYFGYGYTW